jgi:hypothetical protein
MVAAKARIADAMSKNERMFLSLIVDWLRNVSMDAFQFPHAPQADRSCAPNPERYPAGFDAIDLRWLTFSHLFGKIR